MSEKNSHTGAQENGGHSDAGEQNGGNGDRLAGTRKNFLEWTVFAISVLLVGGIISYLGYKVYTHQESPPDIQVTVRHSPADSNANRYHVTFHNRGGKTAETVLVEFQLQREDSVLEKAELEIHYLPKTSSREGWIHFSTPFAVRDSVAVRVVSFKNPS